MKEGGSIILTGSGAWQKGIPVYATYGGTKAALRSFVRTWTAEFAGKGIRTNVISPGPIETPILLLHHNQVTVRLTPAVAFSRFPLSSTARLLIGKGPGESGITKA